VLTKKDFLLDPNVIFLNHGSFGATPRVLHRVYQEWQERLERQPVLFFREAPALLHDARSSLASYVGCDTNELVFVVNSTYGVNVGVHALHLEPGDEVLTTDHEYGACEHAWKFYHEDRGVRMVRQHIPLPVPSKAELEEIIWAGVTERTKVLFLSHITSPTGIVLPVEGLIRRARERGILTFIDGSHVPGHLDLDLHALGADIYTANCHKWMCTPKGSAFLYVRKELEQIMDPLVVSWGWNGYPWKGAKIDPRFATGSYLTDTHEFLGTRDLAAFLTVPAALAWMKEQNWPEVQRRAMELRAYGVRALCTIPNVHPLFTQEADDVLQMGMVLLPDVDTDALKERLYDEHSIEVVVHRWLDRPILRFSVHAHTEQHDIDALVRALGTELEIRRSSLL
jgi:isopenicillin-N epimerase